MRVIKNKQKGFTLIEAMIAVVVFSFGLLGVAGVMLVAVKSNHNGYMRSQATFLAHSIVDAMRRNSWAVWTNVYNGDYEGFESVDDVCVNVPTPGDPSATPPTFATGGCGCTAVANRDTQQWSNMITNTLTNGAGTISCDTTAAYGGFACGEADQPYLGLCTVTITWDESNESSSTSQQSITIVSGP